MKERVTCVALIKQIHDGLEKQANNSLRSQDLTMSQVGVLIELRFSLEKQMTLKELERRLHVAQPTAAGIVARLEQKGFVEGFGGLCAGRPAQVHVSASDKMKENAEEKM